MCKKANRFEARYMYGERGRRCGRHKREGHAHYPGRSVVLPLATGFGRRRETGQQKSAEAIAGCWSATEGLNMTSRE